MSLDLNPTVLASASIWATALLCCVHRVCLAIEKTLPGTKAANVAQEIDQVDGQVSVVLGVKS